MYHVQPLDPRRLLSASIRLSDAYWGTDSSVPVAGQSCFAYVSIQSDTPVPPTTVQFYASANNIAGDGDDILIGSTLATPPADHSRGGFSLQFSVPESLANGDFYLVASAADGATAVSARTAHFYSASAQPDLAIPSNSSTAYFPISYSSDGLHVGSRFAPDASLINLGGASARTTARFVLSADDIYGNADDITLLETTMTVGAYSVSYGNWGGTTIPNTVTPGSYRGFLVVDPENSIAESNEANNVHTYADRITISPVTAD